MAGKSENEKQIAELIRQAAAARNELGSLAASLRRSLDLPARVRASLSGHPGRWMAGSVISGMAASVFFRRKPKATAMARPGSAWLAILAMLAAVAKPLAKAWLMGRLKDWFERPQQTASMSRPVRGPLH